MSTAYSSVIYGSNHVVRLAAGLHCPHCQRELRPTDVELSDRGLRVVCQGCHGDLLTTEAR
jgi:hypothetical protein